MKQLRALKLFAFVILGLGAVLFADLGQALSETFLVPQENRMHSLVNQARSGNGLSTLPNDDGLRWMARRQASAMSARGHIYHNPSLAQDADQASLPWVALGENVGKGPSVEMIQQAFLASPTHRANVMKSDFNALGIGGTADPAATLYFAQVFAGLQQTAPPPQEPAPAPATQPPPPPPTEPPPPPTTPPATPQITAPPSPTSTTEVQGSSPSTEPTTEPRSTSEPASSDTDDDTGEADPTDRLGFFELIIGMLSRFFGKVAFWG